MKTTLLITGLIMFTLIGAQGQDIDECYINNVTGDTIRSTKWELLTNKGDYLLNYRMVRVNSKFSIELKYHFGKKDPFSVLQGDSIWIKFKAGYTMTLYAPKTVNSFKGGANIPGEMKGLVTEGIYLPFDLTTQQFYVFYGSYIEKFRFFTSWGFENMVIEEKEQDEFTRPQNYSTVEAAKLLTQKVKKYKRLSPENETKVNENKLNW